ncbi:MAG: phosphate/phosphite/phosphonate ABC transporter substrate-binding protein [Anaerolineae bacterium]|nr:phosphate/phosphite/phosphonate ABC transporter substrate-binding protein [Anaerolineae bacterium]
MHKFQRILLSLVVAALLVVGTGVATKAQDKTGWPETFIIGVYPGDNIEKAIASNQPLADYLTKTLGVRTVIITGTSYNAVIEAMRAGRADAFEVGPFSYTLAAAVANADAIAVADYSTTVNLERIPGYYSVMITLKGSGIKSIADLKGKTFSFTDPASTSGYLVPSNDIMADQKFTDVSEIDGFVGKTVFAGNHPASVLSVAQGKTDAGATFDDNLADQVKAGAAKICGATDDHATNPFHSALTQEQIMKFYDECPDGDVVVFHQSPLIPQTPFAINKDLPESFKAAVTDALLNIYKDTELVNALGRYYVDPRTINKELKTIDALYDPLREIATNLKIDLTKR